MIRHHESFGPPKLLSQSMPTLYQLLSSVKEKAQLADQIWYYPVILAGLHDVPK
jgi:hypothetical protein